MWPERLYHIADEEVEMTSQATMPSIIDSEKVSTCILFELNITLEKVQTCMVLIQCEKWDSNTHLRYFDLSQRSEYLS